MWDGAKSIIACVGVGAYMLFLFAGMFSAPINFVLAVLGWD